MDTSPHTFQALFDQLGLPSWEEAVERFIDDHRPLDPDVDLPDAAFWNENQREFLRGAIAEDADWAEIVDHLDARLRL